MRPLSDRLDRLDLSNADDRAFLRSVLGMRRIRALDPMRMRAVNSDELTAYASVFGTTYPIGPGINERIVPGAFTESLRAQDGQLPDFYQHAWDEGPVGVASATEDDHGVLVQAKLFDTERARAVKQAAQVGALTRWSVGYYAIDTHLEDKGRTEVITRADLAEVSIVVRGANPDAKTIS
jgi:HK97 family phage prohead protease